MVNYTKTNLGTMADVAKLENGKAFLHDALGLSSCEISVNCAPKGFKVPFQHKHKQNEEVYLILKGEGVFTIDGEAVPVKEGAVVKIAPAAVRTVENTGDGELQFICVQAKDGSLEQFGLGDGELC